MYVLAVTGLDYSVINVHLQGQAIRIQVYGVNVIKTFPILFSIKQQKSIMSFQVPIYLLGR